MLLHTNAGEYSHVKTFKNALCDFKGLSFHFKQGPLQFMQIQLRYQYMDRQIDRLMAFQHYVVDTCMSFKE